MICIGLFFLVNLSIMQYIRNWQLQGSKDGMNWSVLSDHVMDDSLGDPGSTASWTIQRDKVRDGVRHVR